MKMTTVLRRITLTVAIGAVLLLTSAGQNYLEPIRIEEAGEAQLRTPIFKQSIRFWVHKDDVRPRLLRAWPGPAIVSVENEARSNLTVRLERLLPDGNRVSIAPDLSSTLKRRKHEVILAVGEYELYETTRPDIRARLIVAPRQ